MVFPVITFASDDDQKGLAEALRHNALNIGKADHVVIMDQHHPLIQKLARNRRV